jgi:hypothetical protein
MDVKAGLYYRRENDGPIVKVLHENVTYFGTERRGVVYRIRQDGWPTPSEVVSYDVFIETYEGPLDWDTVLKEFK